MVNWSHAYHCLECASEVGTTHDEVESHLNDNPGHHVVTTATTPVS